MITKIYSDDSRFKTLTLHKGMNILVAEKSVEATDKHTRNRAGKSSLIEIIHFLLGSNASKESIFRTDALVGQTFGIWIDALDREYRIERSGSQPSIIKVEGDTSDWIIQPMVKDGSSQLSNENWKVVIGNIFFGLSQSNTPWSPSVRSLLSYFIRRQREGGFEKPNLQARMQRPVDQQVNISFLIGLDWSIPQKWQDIRDSEKSLEQIKKGVDDGTLAMIVGKAAALKSELIIVQDKARKLKASLDSFKVVDEYKGLEEEATRLTKELNDLSDDNFLDRRYLREIEESLSEVSQEYPSRIDELYREVGILFPELVKKRYEDAKTFHDSIVRNRNAYLRAEMNETQVRILDRESKKDKLDSRRAEVMTMLKGTGALDSFLHLQSEYSKVEANVEVVQQKYNSAEALESGEMKLNVERAKLVEELKQDYTEQDGVIEDAVLTFRDISVRLYGEDKAGTLTINPTDNGPEFDPHLPGEKSKGVNNMRIFCFDMMLMLLSIKRGRSPGLLVHDSHLFDGVDERQVGMALFVAAELSEQNGFQYLVTMNSDAVPKELPADFTLEKYLLNVRLTDSSEDGGLFGFRFD